MKTIQASTPDVLAGPQQRVAPAAETISSGRLIETHSTKGKWLAVIAAVVGAAIFLGGIVWLIQRTRNPTASSGMAQSQQAKQTANQPGPTGQFFTENINGVEIKMVSVPSGTFLMGSPASETARRVFHRRGIGPVE